MVRVLDGQSRSFNPVEQTLGVGRDAELPLAERLAENGEPASLALAVDDLLVRERGAQLGAPVDGLLGDVGEAVGVDDRVLGLVVELGPLEQLAPAVPGGGVLARVGVEGRGALAGLELLDEFGDGAGALLGGVVPRVVDLQEDPLRPLVVVGVDGPELAGPVVAEAEPLELAAEVVDGFLGGDLGVDAGLDGVLLGGQAERVPAHRVEDAEPLHLLVSADDVGGGVALGVSDMEPRAGGVGEHIEAVVAGGVGVPAGLAGVGLGEDFRVGPDPLARGLDGAGEVGGVAVDGLVARGHRGRLPGLDQERSGRLGQIRAKHRARVSIAPRLAKGEYRGAYAPAHGDSEESAGGSAAARVWAAD
jgi:hypothetical protein